MKRTLLIAILTTFGLLACLPNVSTELAEDESRDVLINQVTSICKHKSSTITERLHGAINAVEPVATRDYWIYEVTVQGVEREMEIRVYPSRTVGGDFMTYLQTDICK